MAVMTTTTATELVTRWLTTCLVLITVTSHLSSSLPSTEDTPAQPGDQQADYCVPSAWQGGRTVTLGRVGGSGDGTVTRMFGTVTYSARQQKMVTADNVFGSGEYTRRIFDYPAQVLYTITGAVPQTCTKTSLPGPFVPQCVPGTAQETLQHTSYGVDTNAVTTRELSGIQNNAHFRVSLTYYNNVPVFEQIWGQDNGGNYFVNLSFYNVTISSDIPAIAFKPPDICDQVNVERVVGRSLEQLSHLPLWMMP